MRVIDASSMIWAWDNYPIEQAVMVGFWDWFGGEVAKGEVVVPAVALTEINHKVPACRDWLVENQVTVVPVTNQIVQLASAAKSLLGVVNDEYGPKGVDENDLLIIATAKAMGATLISDEGRQAIQPSNIKNCRIPTVCDMPQVAVDCERFLEYFKASGQAV